MRPGTARRPLTVPGPGHATGAPRRRPSHGAAEAAPGPDALVYPWWRTLPRAGGSVVATMLPALSLTLHKT